MLVTCLCDAQFEAEYGDNKCPECGLICRLYVEFFEPEDEQEQSA